MSMQKNMKVRFVYPVILLIETGKRLKSIRLLRGYKVSEVSEYLGGISVQAVYKWERGESIPSTDNLIALSSLYEVRMEDLIVCKESKEADEASSFIGAKDREDGESGRDSFFYHGRREGGSPPGTLFWRPGLHESVLIEIIVPAINLKPLVLGIGAVDLKVFAAAVSVHPLRLVVKGGFFQRA